MSSHFARACAIAIALLTLSIAAFGQNTSERKTDTTTLTASTTSSAAYAELILKKTELQSELEGLILEYTEEYPRVKEIRYVLTLFDGDIARLAKVKAADASKLTEALGKLMTRKIDLETELWRLQANYKDEHPEVKRAKKRVEIFENAIAQILK
jgi:type III secretory pathway component EscV